MNAFVLVVYDTWGVFETERSGGIYRLSAYYLGTLTAEAPSVLVLGVCYGITCYWVTGLTPNASCFFYFLLILVLGMFLAQVRLCFNSTFSRAKWFRNLFEDQDLTITSTLHIDKTTLMNIVCEEKAWGRRSHAFPLKKALLLNGECQVKVKISLFRQEHCMFITIICSKEHCMYITVIECSKDKTMRGNYNEMDLLRLDNTEYNKVESF